jgi:transcriptional regulator with XRE-family HTH domain
MGKSQQDMGEIIGAGRTNSQWSEFERGERRISFNKALKLTQHPELLGLTLEWVYKGVPMFTELGERVREAERAILASRRQPDEAPRPRRRRVPN